MTETILTIGIPTLAVLVGILLNRNDANRLDARVTTLDSSLRGEIAAMRKQMHDDILTMVGVTNELDKRLNRIEPR